MNGNGTSKPLDMDGVGPACFNLRRVEPRSSDESTARQAMLDCIERTRLPQGVPA